MQVWFGLSFVQLIQINEKAQVMTANVWLTMVWNDYQLEWDPADYGGVKVLRLPSHSVWRPDIVLFNNADGNYEVQYDANCLVYPSGLVMWVPPAIYQSSCVIDVKYFPFDVQTCQLTFGSWTFGADQVQILHLDEQTKEMDMTAFVPDGTWDVISGKAYINTVEDSGGEGQKVDIWAPPQSNMVKARSL